MKIIIYNIYLTLLNFDAILEKPDLWYIFNIIKFWCHIRETWFRKYKLIESLSIDKIQ